MGCCSSNPESIRANKEDLGKGASLWCKAILDTAHPWRTIDQSPLYKRDELYIDVVETTIVNMTTTGAITTRPFIIGEVEIKAYLSDIPVCCLGFAVPNKNRTGKRRRSADERRTPFLKLPHMAEINFSKYTFPNAADILNNYKKKHADMASEELPKDVNDVVYFIPPALEHDLAKIPKSEDDNVNGIANTIANSDNNNVTSNSNSDSIEKKDDENNENNENDNPKNGSNDNNSNNNNGSLIAANTELAITAASDTNTKIEQNNGDEDNNNGNENNNENQNENEENNANKENNDDNDNDNKVEGELEVGNEKEGEAGGGGAGGSSDDSSSSSSSDSDEKKEEKKAEYPPNNVVINKDCELLNNGNTFVLFNYRFDSDLFDVVDIADYKLSPFIVKTKMNINDNSGNNFDSKRSKYIKLYNFTTKLHSNANDYHLKDKASLAHNNRKISFDDADMVFNIWDKFQPSKIGKVFNIKTSRGSCKYDSKTGILKWKFGFGSGVTLLVDGADAPLKIDFCVETVLDYQDESPLLEKMDNNNNNNVDNKDANDTAAGDGLEIESKEKEKEKEREKKDSVVTSGGINGKGSIGNYDGLRGSIAHAASVGGPGDPIAVFNCSIPMMMTSGLIVRFCRIENPIQMYKTVKWVRYKTAFKYNVKW